MTAPARPLKPRQRLEGELNLLPSDVGLSSAAFDDRIKLWAQLAAERAGATEAQQYQHLKALAIRAWITALSRKADKFRAEGDVTTERDILGRIERLEALEAAAIDQAGLNPDAPADGDGAAADTECGIVPWGVCP